MRTKNIFIALVLMVAAVLLSVPMATAAPEGPQSVLTYTAPAKEKIDKETFDCKIASHKFDKATGVGTITFKGQLKAIRGSRNYYSFYGSAITNIVIPNSVTSIGGGAFYGCSSLKSITIPNSVTSIGGGAFYECSSLTSVTIPNSVTSIGGGAFYGCSSLKSITIPNSVTSIGEDAFSGCTGELIVNCNIPNSSVNHYDEYRGQYRYKGPFIGSKFTKVTIGDGVTSIGEYAFYDCSRLTSVTIPDSVTTIGEKAFRTTYDIYCNLEDVNVNITDLAKYCTNNVIHDIPGNKHLYIDNKEITELTIPDSVTSIGSSAFRDCCSLTSITIPDSVTWIGGYAFEGCYALKDVNVNITDLAKYCTNNVIHDIPGNKHLYIDNKEITELTIPDSVTSIGSSAFRDCDSLTSITIPDSVTSIGYEAFEGCYALKDVNVNITDLAKYCTNEAIHKIPGNKHFYIDNKEITELTIPDSVTEIGERAFYGCSSLTDVITPERWINIFVDCVSVKTINGKEKISDGSFKFVGDVLVWVDRDASSVSIPVSVKSIASFAFEGCKYLENVNVADLNVWLRSGVDMSSSDGWNLYHNGKLVTNVTIPNGVSEIAHGQFCDNKSLTIITIPDSVTEIGNIAFYGCSSLISVTISNGVTKIGDKAFYECDNLCSITIPASVKEIGDYAFCGCTSLTNVTISNGVTKIGDKAFYNCSRLGSITIPASVKEIGGNAFGPNYEGFLCIYMQGTTPPKLLGTFENNIKYYSDWQAKWWIANFGVFVPERALFDYRSADVWKEMADKIEPRN